MSRLKPKTDSSQISRLVGKVEVYFTRLGEHRYTLVFLSPVYQNGRRIVLRYAGNIVDGRMYGMFTGLRMEEVRGKKVKLVDVPDTIIEDAIRWLPC